MPPSRLRPRATLQTLRSVRTSRPSSVAVPRRERTRSLPVGAPREASIRRRRPRSKATFRRRSLPCSRLELTERNVSRYLSSSPLPCPTMSSCHAASSPPLPPSVSCSLASSLTIFFHIHLARAPYRHYSVPIYTLSHVSDQSLPTYLTTKFHFPLARIRRRRCASGSSSRCPRFALARRENSDRRRCNLKKGFHRSISLALPVFETDLRSLARSLYSISTSSRRPVVAAARRRPLCLSLLISRAPPTRTFRDPRERE